MSMDPLKQKLDVQDHQVVGELIAIIELWDQWSAQRRNLAIQMFNEWRTLQYVVYFRKNKNLLDVLDLSFVNCE